MKINVCYYEKFKMAVIRAAERENESTNLSVIQEPVDGFLKFKN